MKYTRFNPEISISFMSSILRAKKEKIFILRSKIIDKFVIASYNIYNQTKLMLDLIQQKGGRHLGKGKKKRKKEKELLEQRQIKIQIYESLTAIIATIVTMLLAVITAVLSWID